MEVSSVKIEWGRWCKLSFDEISFWIRRDISMIMLQTDIRRVFRVVSIGIVLANARGDLRIGAVCLTA